MRDLARKKMWTEQELFAHLNAVRFSDYCCEYGNSMDTASSAITQKQVQAIAKQMINDIKNAKAK